MRWRRPLQFLLLVTPVLWLLGWNDRGITWDESVQARYGDLVLDDFFATTRYGADGMFPESPIVHVVGREGAAFTVIRAGKGAKRPPP